MQKLGDAAKPKCFDGFVSAFMARRIRREGANPAAYSLFGTVESLRHHIVRYRHYYQHAGARMYGIARSTPVRTLNIAHLCEAMHD
jgi:hypothetical protein